MKEKAEEYHQIMLEAVCDTDEELMMKYLEGEEITVDELKKAIRKAVVSNAMFPVLCGSAYKNKGIQMLLDAVVDLPFPVQIRIPVKKITVKPTIKNRFRLWPLRSWRTPLSVSLLSSGSIPVRWKPALMCTIRRRAKKNVSAVSCACTPITVKKSKSPIPVISVLLSG